MTRTGIFNIWAAPWDWARTATAMAEVAWAAPAVIAARMPLIVAASISPCDADTRELTRMVTEKADASENQAAFSRHHIARLAQRSMPMSGWRQDLRPATYPAPPTGFDTSIKVWPPSSWA